VICLLGRLAVGALVVIILLGVVFGEELGFLPVGKVSVLKMKLLVVEDGFGLTGVVDDVIKVVVEDDG